MRGQTMENKVIEFPKKKSLKARLMNREVEKKAMLSLSLASVFLVTIFLNEWLKVSQHLDSKEKREIASVGAVDLKKEIDWEHNWARKLSSTEVSVKGQTALKPSLKDEFLYGALEGLYNVQFRNGKILSLELNSMRQTGQNPDLDPVALLKKYKSLIHDRLADVRAVRSEDHKKVFELLSDASQVVGRAVVEFNDNGAIQKIDINPVN